METYYYIDFIMYITKAGYRDRPGRLGPILDFVERHDSLGSTAVSTMV